MNVNDFDYELPGELIAQKPAEQRDWSRLLVVHRDGSAPEHRHFYDILDYLRPGDCLVMNNSKVLPARLFGTKEGTGAKVEFLLIKRVKGDIWETMVRPGRRLKPGDRVSFAPDFQAEIVDYGQDGTRLAEFHYTGIFMERLEELGKMPLPPYIERESAAEDKERYQTVYCQEEGSVAAPTAGLHFTKELLQKAEEKGVKLAYVTLHVGIGTFRPVKCERVEDHQMHFEEYEITAENARIINETKAAGGRVISVGTTSVRTLESAAVMTADREAGQKTGRETGPATSTEAALRAETVAKKESAPKTKSESKSQPGPKASPDLAEPAECDYQIAAGTGSTGIFIYPGYHFKMIDALITNFHLPKSTLLMLVSAFYDREKILDVYRLAVAEKYRFFSYGDAMLLL